MHNHQTKPDIIVIASESGGHILPALTLAQQEQAKGNSVTFISGSHRLDHQLVTAQPYLNAIIRLKLAKRTSKLMLPLIFCQLIFSFFKSLRLLIRHRPKKVISTGGLIALPVCFAAALLRIPRDVHELNAVPGMAVNALLPTLNYFYSPFVHHHPKWRQSEYPLRKEILTQPKKPLTHNKQLCLFVQGGSQGSVSLNNLVLRSLEHYEDKDALFIAHQTGAHDVKRIMSWYEQHNIAAHVFTFEQNLACYYATANLIISRAGAGSLFEIIAWKKQAIIIPLVAGTTSHQVDNARAMAQIYPTLITVHHGEEKINIITQK